MKKINVLLRIKRYLLISFIFGSISVAWSGAHNGPGMPDIAPTEIENLGDGLYTFRWGPYRNIFLVTDEGVIATDPLGIISAPLYRKAIRGVTDQPVRYVIYSHSHWDHIAGGSIFKEEGAEFIAQEKCAENLNISPNPEVIDADITFKDFYRVELGNKSIDIHHYGPIHDNCMSVMLVNPANKIFVVDIVSPPTGRALPFDAFNDPDFHYGNAGPYLQAVEDLAERNQVKTIVGAHLVLGPDGSGKTIIYPSTGPVIALTERREYYEQILSAVKAELDIGTPILSVHNKIDLDPFRDMWGFDEAKMRLFLQRAVYFYVLGK
ncbi:MAG: MBL fold metallo-hydrolase [Pseudomonadota bacterium]|nr:MBL fold metallo-hydrolase [Pseudomonadota bacterium]